ncbi:MAG: hypothetical protein ACOX40_01815 [Bacilli bacterium]|jgi:hypothetical protein|nr:hypothetical protein [Acholeplasmataceae bacterium]
MSKKGYFGFGRLLSIIFAIIPVTNIIFGVIIRIEKNQILLAILNILIAPIFYIVDLVSILLNNKLKYLI